MFFSIVLSHINAREVRNEKAVCPMGAAIARGEQQADTAVNFEAAFGTL